MLPLAATRGTKCCGGNNGVYGAGHESQVAGRGGEYVPCCTGILEHGWRRGCVPQCVPIHTNAIVNRYFAL